MGFEEYNKNRRKIGGWTCPFCSKVFAVRSELRSHQKQEHNGQKNTVECKCQYCEKSFNRTCSKTLHERYCLQNPNKEIKLGHPHTEEAKQLISNGMKLAHKEGRTSSWIGRRKRSYAEQYWFNIFKGTNIVNNFFIKDLHYWLDFANVDKKLYFEVDGKTHSTEEGIAYDNERTKNLSLSGWTLVGRCNWSEFQKLSFEDRSKYIEKIYWALVVIG